MHKLAQIALAVRQGAGYCLGIGQRNGVTQMAQITRTDAALILSEAIAFMANKAGVTALEIVAAIEANRGGPVETYLRQLLAVGGAAALVARA